MVTNRATSTEAYAILMLQEPTARSRDPVLRLRVQIGDLARSSARYGTLRPPVRRLSVTRRETLHGSRFGRCDALELPPASVQMSRLDHLRKRSVRALAEECPVVLVYQGTTVAVVMATPPISSTSQSASA